MVTLGEPCKCCKGRRCFITPSLFDGYLPHVDLCTRCGASGIEPGSIAKEVLDVTTDGIPVGLPE